MKNLYVLPTDKPSKLIYNDANDLCYQSNKSAKNDRKWLYRKKFHIYITSDEEIKEGWILVNGFILRQVDYIDGYMVIDTTGGKHHNSVCRKIILTTDQNLIKDGVQAIDDEFLEWFVKNPSCESVEIGKKCNYGECICYLGKCQDNENIYKIITPQKEPKQKTLEDAAENYISKKILMYMLFLN